MNVLYLTKYLAPEYETMLLVGEKEAHEKDASFLAKQMGIETVYVPDMGRSIRPFRDYRAFKHLQQIIKKFKPDIVHTHAAKPGAVGRMAARSMRVPVVVHTYHGHVFHSYFGKMKTQFIINTERYLAKKSDMLVAISHQQKKELSSEFKIAPENKFRIIPLGFELEKFLTDQDKKRKRFREEFGIADHEVAIGITGRLVPIKNHFLFLEGNSSKQIKAFIIGDGETRQAIEQKATALGIQFSSPEKLQPGAPLIFTSWRSDIDVINAGLDIIALTSLNEGTPVSLIEAQAANKPVIATKVGGITDIVSEGETALLSDVNDISGFSKNLLRLVNDDKLRNQLGKNASQFVLKKYSVQRLAADMSALYKELLNGRS